MSLSKTFILLIVWLVAGCSKADTGPAATKDTSPPVITIVSPANNQIYSPGQTIQIRADAVDDNKITELHIHVLNKTSGALLRDIHSFPGNKTATVLDSFEALAGFTYTIKIIAFDLSQNLATAQVDVSVQ